MAQSRAYLLFGIDFGTTYSGVAWAWSERLEDKNVVMNWEDIEGQKLSAKVPSKILYKGDQIRWGFDIPPDEKPLQWFKLLLLRDEDMDEGVRDSTYIKEAKEMLNRLHKSAEDVIADYLGLLWKHVLKELRIDLGEAAVDGQPFRVVITFPAIWPLYAQSRMRQAAATAGILDPRHGGETKLSLCPEPEAAALAVMDDFHGHPVESGDIFVICDAGGGTADLITYQLEDTTMWDLAECVSGAGKLCGAIFVDEAFDRNMAGWVGDKKWKRLSDSSKREWKETFWERGLKKKFDGEDRELSLHLPVQLVVNQSLKIKLFSRGGKTSRPQIRDHMLRLQSYNIAGVFDSSVNQIVTLTLDQIKRTKQRLGNVPKAVLLVGGFGQSPYLLKRLQAEVQSQGIEIRKPPEERAWTAICRGALIRASILNAHDGNYIMQGNITSRVVRRSYGIAIIEPFNPAVHLERDKQYIPALDEECAVNQIHWYIRTNESVGEQQIIKLDWSRKIRSQLPRNRFTVTLLKCDQENPPRRRDEDVRIEGEIVCQVNKPFDQLPQYINPKGEIWKNLDFEVEMKPCGTMLEFAAYYNGQRQRVLQVSPPFASTREETSALALT